MTEFVALRSKTYNIKHKKQQINIKITATFKSKKHNVFNKEVNKIAQNANDDETIQLIDSIETIDSRYAYGITEEIIHKKEGIKCIGIINQYEK